MFWILSLRRHNLQLFSLILQFVFSFCWWCPLLCRSSSVRCRPAFVYFFFCCLCFSCHQHSYLLIAKGLSEDSNWIEDYEKYELFLPTKAPTGEWTSHWKPMVHTWWAEPPDISLILFVATFSLRCYLISDTHDWDIWPIRVQPCPSTVRNLLSSNFR